MAKKLTKKERKEVKKEAMELLNQVLIALKDIEEAEVEHDGDTGYQIVMEELSDEEKIAWMKEGGNENPDVEDFDEWEWRYESREDMDLEALKAVVKELTKGSSVGMITQYYNSNCY